MELPGIFMTDYQVSILYQLLTEYFPGWKVVDIDTDFAPPWRGQAWDAEGRLVKFTAHERFPGGPIYIDYTPV